MFRYLFGWLVPPPISLLKLTQTKTTKRLYELHHVVQDILLPISKLSEALSMIDEEVKVYMVTMVINICDHMIRYMIT